jgi:hypothetical protein
MNDVSEPGLAGGRGLARQRSGNHTPTKILPQRHLLLKRKYSSKEDAEGTVASTKAIVEAEDLDCDSSEDRRDEVGRIYVDAKANHRISINL